VLFVVSYNFGAIRLKFYMNNSGAFMTRLRLYSPLPEAFAGFLFPSLPRCGFCLYVASGSNPGPVGDPETIEEHPASLTQRDASRDPYSRSSQLENEQKAR
jgi:hypothetical protein